MNHKSTKGRRIFMDDLSHGVEATIIDLGLSRMDAGDGGCGDNVHWTPFDEEVFMGEGRFYPITNVQGSFLTPGHCKAIISLMCIE
jgi:serine/threonine-protein kinase haspin